MLHFMIFEMNIAIFKLLMLAKPGPSLYMHSTTVLCDNSWQLLNVRACATGGDRGRDRKTEEKLVLENSVNESDFQQHVRREREPSRLPHRTRYPTIDRNTFAS